MKQDEWTEAMIAPLRTVLIWHCIVFLAAMAMWVSSPAWADSAYDPIMAHLDFLGYQSDVVDQGVRARHSSKLHIVVSYQKGGILVQTAFPGKSPEQDVPKRHAVANGVNLRTQVSRAVWTSEGHLFMSAWMPGLYDKTRFALFMEAWERDSQVLAGRGVRPKTLFERVEAKQALDVP
jgi:hypothetical protein